MILAEKLTKRYRGRKVLDGFSFRVSPGEAVALWGHNGAGKSTTLKCILGLLTYQGSLQVAGQEVSQGGASVRALVGYVPQSLAYYDWSVAQTVRFFASLKGAPAEQGGRVLQQVELQDAADKEVGALSGGMRQRLALALALLGDPPLLLLDEPTASLDTRAKGDLMKLLVQLKEQGKTLLFASHRPDEVRTLADRILFLEQGHQVDERMVADLKGDELG